MIPKHILLSIGLLAIFSCTSGQSVLIDESDKTESVAQVIEIDSVWAGHPVGFCLYTHGDRQYIAYYNANRNLVVGQRNLVDENFVLHILAPTTYKSVSGTSTILKWDSHNYLTLGIDKEGFIHLAGNMHANPITYFKSTSTNDISTLVQEMEMIGSNEKKCTYPHFLLSKKGELIFHYRDGGSGNGSEIYNAYSSETKNWSRMLDVPLTDGEGLMNAYQTTPTILEDGWYHVYWVWRDTPDCETNHDLSYMKSPDLKNWFDGFGNKIELPATLDKKGLIVDPIPIKGGIINLSAKLCLDENNSPLFVYHKYDSDGNLQVYVAYTYIDDKKWIHKQLTQWDYRWEFSGRGSIDVEFRFKGFKKRTDGKYEIDYWHIKYGNGTLLLNSKFENIGEVLKAESFISGLKVEGGLPGLLVQTSEDIGHTNDQNFRYVLKWETLNKNRDLPRVKPWPNPSKLILYKLKAAEQ
jgi:hypothetical protein